MFIVIRKLNISYTLINDLPYQSGFYLSWNSDGIGISSACATFSLGLFKEEADLQLKHQTNITTKLEIAGIYNSLEGSSRNLTVNCKIFNEGEPCLAENFTISYEYDGEPSNQDWIVVTPLSNIDYGNGTYLLSLIAETQSVNDPMLVSVQVYDKRGVFVLANVTCTEID